LDSQLFRRTLGHFATGVTVIISELSEGLHGMTANSLTSISLDPPLILVSIDLHAKMRGAMTPGRPFTVNILKDSQASVSTLFANPDPADNPFDNVALLPSANGVPYMAEALAYIACRVETVYPGGDHALVLSLVEEMAPLSTSGPLLFYQGHYRTVNSLPSE
jgi:flavin reductase (DIM6/NTAB) family NADH-FMN oxidoreductase RutF